ncbi:MAG: Ig-like domain-containing protein [Limisphaerales bacterium]
MLGAASIVPPSPNSSSQGASGGGALRVLGARKTFHLDGDITVKGSDAHTNALGGAAGGSVWLSVGHFSGTGRIIADGGSALGTLGSGGGGGRIAVHSDTNVFQGVYSAKGGTGVNAGGAGTVYLRTGAQVQTGTLIVDNGGLTGANTPLFGWNEAGSLNATGGAVVSGTAPTQILKSLSISEDSRMIFTNTPTQVDFIIHEDAVINGEISLDARGYAGVNGGPAPGEFSGSGAGGSHGGTGGMSASGAASGPVYGSETTPVDLGSRGGMSVVSTNDSQGGGALRLQVGRDLVVNGRISANGRDAWIDRHGGGAGGSVWITASTLLGDGSIAADGGAGEPIEGGGGGGGRVAIYALTNLFNGIVSVKGGYGWNNGGDGSIFFGTVVGPTVKSHSPAGNVGAQISSMQIIFDSVIDLSTVSIADFLINTPNGHVDPTSITVLGANSVRVNFPPQNTPGLYSVQVGPQIQNAYGMEMPTVYSATFTITPLTITGNVVDTDGAPSLEGITLQPSGGLPPVVTGESGAFTISVPPNWSGIISVSDGHRRFIPESRSYTNLVNNVGNQNFIRAYPNLLSVSTELTSTNVSFAIHGIQGVTYQPYYSTNLVDWLPYSAPVLGSNELIQLQLPMTNGPQTFFRYQLSY